MACQFLPNMTITENLQWGQISETFAQNRTCASNYIRPDIGGARMPWLITVLQIVIHMPVIVLRVARWEDVQTLSIVLAAINVAIICQAYAATNLTAAHVLVWSPMALVLDAGAMLQLVILVKTVHPDWWKKFRTKLRPQPIKDEAELRLRAPMLAAAPQQRPNPGNPGDQAAESEEAGPLFVAFVIITSSLLFVTIFGLQITALVAAFRGQKDNDIQASWCSPSFGLFTVSELDLDCTFHTVITDAHKGIGCIELPGKRQYLWLMVTIISILVSVVLEAVDFVILYFVPTTWQWWVVELKRPWMTIVFGFTTLVVIMAFGAIDAYTLPPGISDKVWLIVDSGDPFVCASILTPAGLRGQFLGWLDGLLQSWEGVYFGPA